MFRNSFKKVLLVAPDVFPDRLLTDYKNITHISNAGSIFPSLYEINPEMIIFDYDYVRRDIEKVLRRIHINKFYNKLKVCCYKSVPNEKTDSLLKELGVDYIIYHADFTKPQKNRTILNNFSAIFDTSILKWVANVSN